MTKIFVDGLNVISNKKENKMINSLKSVQPISAAAERAKRVIVKASSILPPLKQPQSTAVYTSPFAPISTPVPPVNAGKILNFFG